MDQLNQAATIGTINPARAVANGYEIHDNVRVILTPGPMPRGI
jgi:hypothetical protein